MDRRSWIARVTTFGLAGLASWRVAGGREPEVDPEAMRIQLVQGLKATTADQRSYIDRVITLVTNKKLSASLVYAIYKWSRKRYPQFPFIYFQRALNLMAKKQGVVI